MLGRRGGLGTAALALCAVALLSVHQAQAMYTAGSGVVDLTASNFQSKIKGEGGVWLVEFYAPWVRASWSVR